MFETTREELELELMKRENKSWGEHAKDVGATVGRTVAGAVASPLDIITMPYNVVQGIRGKEGFSFAEKAKGVVDNFTDSRGKPTSEAGKLAETAADFISPFGLAKVAQKFAVKGAQKLGQHIAKGSEKVRQTIPGRTGKVVDTLVGPKALKNVYAKPTVGNMAGIGAAHLVSSENPLPGMLSAIGANVLTDIAGAAFGKGVGKIKSVNRTMKLKNPEIRAEVEKRLGSENLTDLKSKQERNTAHELEREQSVNIKNKQNEDSYKKAVSDSHKADYNANIAGKNAGYKAKVETYNHKIAEHSAEIKKINADKLAWQKHEESMKPSAELDKHLGKITNTTAGKAAVAKTYATSVEHKKLFNNLFKVKGELESKLGSNAIVPMQDIVAHFNKKFNSNTTVREIQNFFDNDQIKIAFDIPHSAGMRTKINKMFNASDNMTLKTAQELQDSPTKMKEMSTNAERGEEKLIAGMAKKAEDLALEATDPKKFARLQKAREKYKEYTPFRSEINAVTDKKYNPAEVADLYGKSLSKDAHTLSVASNPETSLNVLRNWGKTKTGKIDKALIAERLLELDPDKRKLFIDSLPKEYRKEIKDSISDYIKNSDRTKQKLSDDKYKHPKAPEAPSPFDAGAPYKEPIQKPEKIVYKNEQPKSYDGKGVGDVQSYLDSLSPEHRGQIGAEKGVQESIHQSKKIDALSREKFPVKWIQNSAHAIRDTGQSLFGESQAKSIPKVAEEVKRLSARPEQTKNIAQRSKEKIGEVSSKAPISKLASIPKHQHKEYETTREELELELMKRENNKNVLHLGTIDVPRQ